MSEYLFNKISEKDYKVYYNELDFIKSIAIISVIILHTVQPETLTKTFAPFHIWQAVPVFIIIAGINSTLSGFRRGEFSLRNEYAVDKYVKYSQRILIPFTIVWLFEILIFVLPNKVTLKEVFLSYFTGGIGPGGYFIPVFIQHLVFFPIFIWLKNKLKSQNHYIGLICFFCISMMFEWLCVKLLLPEWLYRIMYVRYFFAAVIGSYMVSNGFSKKDVLLTIPFSVTYIICVVYLKYDFQFIYSAWGFHHAPAFFFTALLVSCLWRIYPYINKRVNKIFISLGKASYHVFLFQIIWFLVFDSFFIKFIYNELVHITVNIFSCSTIGYILYKSHLFVSNFLKVIVINNKTIQA